MRIGGIMKFVIPQNYNFKNKIFGISDYSTAFFLCVDAEL